MRNASVIFGSLLILSALLIPDASLAQGGGDSQQAVMKVSPNGHAGNIAQGVGAQIRDSILEHMTFLLALPEDAEIDTILAALEERPDVVFAEPNYELILPESFQMSISFPDDNKPPLIDGESPILYYDQEAVYSLGLEEAHTIATGAGVVVAVIDNGVALAHPLLVDRVLATGYDFLDTDDDPNPDTGAYFGHGTFVSGLIVRTAPDCALLPLRAFDGNGIGNSFAVTEAIYHAVENGADVINMSFGMYTVSEAMAEAVATAESAGLTLVAAAGNDASMEPTYPASFPGVIAVSGIDNTDLLAAFSNYGDYIDVCAPAVDIYSALAGEYEWGTWSGTSFAAPFVSGAAALVSELDPLVGPFAMEEHIRQTAETVLAWGTVTVPDQEYGFGRLDMLAATTELTPSTSNQYGDLNGSGRVDCGDIVYLCQFAYMGGPGPVPPGQPDVDCNEVIDDLDVQYYIDHVFQGGPKPRKCNQ